MHDIYLQIVASCMEKNNAVIIFLIYANYLLKYISATFCHDYCMELLYGKKYEYRKNTNVLSTKLFNISLFFLGS